MTGLLGGAGVALLGRAIAQGQTAPGVTTGDCSRLEGLQLLIDWLAQREVLSPEELRPFGNWRLFSTSGVPAVFLYPGDWTAYPMWASGLTRAGAIAWQPQPSSTSYLAGARIVSPDGKALYEYVSGSLVGFALSLQQAALAAEQGVLGDGEAITPICTYEDTVSFTQNWTRGGSYGDLSVVTGGNLYSSADPYLSTAIISYQSFVGPKAHFTSLMRTVYIPIMFQFMTGGSSINRTPTPTATP
jgi:hypothetical protein